MNLDELAQKIECSFLSNCGDNPDFSKFRDEVKELVDEFKSSFAESFKRTIVEASRAGEE
jgi:hypothetical protein